VHVLDAQGAAVPAGETGNLVVRLPLPPGCFTTLWQNDIDFVRTYFSSYPGYYLTSDAGYIDADGYLWIMGRTDDIINIAGHRLSTACHGRSSRIAPDVAERAVGAYDPRGEVLPILSS
jgi:propionyl-CoA synthetase